MNSKPFVVDTNFVYSGLQETFGQFKIVLMSTVKQELDNHKTADSQALQYQSRQANRFIFNNLDSFIQDNIEYDAEKILGKSYSNEVNDNKIVACAVANGYGILTNDLNLYTTAVSFGLEVYSFEEDKGLAQDDIKGFKEVSVTDPELSLFNVFSLEENKYDLDINEYLILRSKESNMTEVFVWTGECHERVKDNLRFNNEITGEFKPKDLYQLIAMDSIIRNVFTILRGKAGTAKTLLTLSYALQELKSSRNYDRITIITNNLPAKNAFYNGWVKGTLLEKLLDSSIGNMLSSKLGDKDIIIDMIMQGDMELIPLSDVRGWEAKKGSVVILSEAQNYDREALKLALQRIPEGCKVIVEGDNKTQLDDSAFEGRNNGMRIASEVFKGQKYFGQVELQNIYRSEIADRAELMSDWH